MDKFERGKRAEIDIYDDIFDITISSPISFYDNMIEEKYEKIIDKWNSLGCTSFMLTSKQIEELLNNKIGD